MTMMLAGMPTMPTEAVDAAVMRAEQPSPEALQALAAQLAKQGQGASTGLEALAQMASGAAAGFLGNKAKMLQAGQQPAAADPLAMLAGLNLGG